MKKTYTVYIEEKLCKGTEVEADSIEEAESIVAKMYHNSEVILDSSDFGGDPLMRTESEEVGEYTDPKESTDWHDF